MGIKIYDKEAITITKTLLHLQEANKLVDGMNIKSITTDNISEFYDWKNLNDQSKIKTMILMFIFVINIMFEKKAG